MATKNTTVTIIEEYFDKKLERYVKPGEQMTVTPARAKQLKEAGVAK